jgi:hypothetical protein
MICVLACRINSNANEYEDVDVSNIKNNDNRLIKNKLDLNEIESG